VFYLESDPHAELQDFLKLFRSVIPTVVVAELMSWQVIVE